MDKRAPVQVKVAMSIPFSYNLLLVMPDVYRKTSIWLGWISKMLLEAYHTVQYPPHYLTWASLLL